MGSMIQNMRKIILLENLGLSIDKNSVHGSDSVDNAKSEINFFLKLVYLNILIIASG